MRKKFQVVYFGGINNLEVHVTIFTILTKIMHLNEGMAIPNNEWALALFSVPRRGITYCSCIILYTIIV